MHSSEENESATTSEREVRRIGLIVVHGIGDQGRFHFLDALVRDLQCGFKAARENAIVSVVLHTPAASLVGAAAPTLSEGPGPSAEIVILDEKWETRVGIHEVWWGDIIDPPTIFQPLRFFAWGLAMWAVPLKHRRTFEKGQPGKVGEFLAEPDPPEGRGFLTKLGVRARLFLVGYLVITAGIVLYLVTALLRLITRQNIPDPVMTAVSYMSDIKLYTQPTSPDTVPLDHLGQHARFAIRARMLRTTVDAALRDYDGWWVLAHSLGSVVAFSGLMTPEGLIARYLDEPRWRRLEADAKAALFNDETKVPKDTRVDRPAWLEPDACVSHKELFKRFRGLVTYGSPLDKFAMLWPATIPTLRDQTPFGEATWHNFYDETDPVSGRLDSFDKVGAKPAGLRPRNIPYCSSPIPLLSHVKYLGVPRRDRKGAQDSLTGRLCAWFLDTSAPASSPKIPKFEAGKGGRWLSEEMPKWKARRAWNWVFWIGLAILSPLFTAWIVDWLRQSGWLDGILPDFMGWPSLLPQSMGGLALAIAALAVLIVLAAGLLGKLLAFSIRDIDPEAPASAFGGVFSGDTTGTAKPAVKDSAPYA
ncbi:hypothetical protein N825_21730 [Skermanella stibiiresistens SB22]|uniref:Uncharacterized protein n=2 Tax=Skermanella TaxID=204447 RepID=W9GTG0_9PROT|nr:hypothetical protein N825_21730 [Skermanella stibiiresistens SB22]